MEPLRILAKGLSADLGGIAPERLQDAEALRRLLLHACDVAGLTRISEALVHKFSGGGEGVTGMVMLSESHVAFHSYPESGQILIDVLTCGKAKPERVVEEFRNELQAKTIQLMPREHPNQGQ